MPKDLTIRELGRPQISKESQIGLQKITRKFVAQGNRVAVAQLNDATNPLFLAVGTADEEYTDHVLVNQQITSASGDVDRAYLTREYVQLRNTFFAESSNQSSDLIRISRKYAVLRSDDATYGYGTTNPAPAISPWAKHPNNPSANYTSSTPWEYAPEWITPPATLYQGYQFSQTGGFAGASITLDDINDTSVTPTFTPLNTYLNTATFTMGTWLKGRVSVSQAGPGIDIWDIEWITHNTPYWTLGTAKGGSTSSVPISVVAFDLDGVHVDSFGSSGGSSSSVVVAKTKVIFSVGPELPTDLVAIAGGSDTSYFPNNVNIDLNIVTQDRKTIVLNRTINNAVFDVTNILGTADGATRSKRRLTFAYTETNLSNPTKKFKNQLVRSIGGSISWTRSHVAYTSGSSTTNFNSTSTKVTPLFSFQDENGAINRIWKTEITYLG